MTSQILKDSAESPLRDAQKILEWEVSHPQNSRADIVDQEEGADW